MLVLALDASGQAAGAALVTEEKVLAECVINCGLTHSRTLMPLVDHIAAITDTDLRDVDFIACTSGPGSFTGLRIGAAAAAGLAAGLSKDLVEIPTLDALAYNIIINELPDNALGKAFCAAPIMDARRNQVYAALYTSRGGKTCRITDYMADDIEVILAIVRETGLVPVFLGDGVFPHKERLLAEGFKIAPPNNLLQRPASVGALALTMASKTVTPSNFKLMYVRKPQAERELEGKNQ